MNFDYGRQSCPTLIPQQPPNENYSTIEVGAFEYSRISGGAPANLHLASFLVLFITTAINGSSRICTGTLISPVLALTAAHCFLSNETIAIVNSRDENDDMKSIQINVSKFVAHPNFNLSVGVSLGAPFDIAYVRLKNRIPNYANYMRINVNQTLPSPKNAARALGYGSFDDDISFSNPTLQLHQVDLPIVPGFNCSMAYRSLSISIIEKRQICAGYYRFDCGAWYVSKLFFKPIFFSHIQYSSLVHSSLMIVHKFVTQRPDMYRILAMFFW